MKRHITPSRLAAQLEVGLSSYAVRRKASHGGDTSEARLRPGLRRRQTISSPTNLAEPVQTSGPRSKEFLSRRLSLPDRTEKAGKEKMLRLSSLPATWKSESM